MPESTPDLLSSLPAYVNAILMAGVFVGGAILGILGYKKKLEAPEAPPKPVDMAIMGGAFADRSAMDRLSTVLERIAEVLERGADANESRQTEMLKEIHERLTGTRVRAPR